jgi:hypothetical protein
MKETLDLEVKRIQSEERVKSNVIRKSSNWNDLYALHSGDAFLTGPPRPLGT